MAIRHLLTIFIFVLIGLSITGCGSLISKWDTADFSEDLEQARQLIADNQIPDARRVLREAQERDIHNWQLAFDAFAVWLRSGHYDEAIREGRKTIERRDELTHPRLLTDEEMAGFILLVSYAAHEKGDDSLSLELNEQALELDPNNPEAANGVAWILSLKERDLDRALMLAERAVEAKPTAAHIVDTLGWVHHKMGNQQEAIKWLSQAVKLNPNSAELRQHLAEAHLSRNNLPGAYVENRKALRLNPRLEDALVFGDDILELYNPPGPL